VVTRGRGAERITLMAGPFATMGRNPASPGEGSKQEEGDLGERSSYRGGRLTRLCGEEGLERPEELLVHR